MVLANFKKKTDKKSLTSTAIFPLIIAFCVLIIAVVAKKKFATFPSSTVHLDKNFKTRII